MNPSIHCLICVSNEVCEEPALWILYMMSYLLKCSMGNGVSTASNLCLFHEGVFVNYPSSSFAQRGVQKKKKKKSDRKLYLDSFYNRECILTANLEYSVKTVYIIWEIKKKLMFQDDCGVHWLALHSRRLFQQPCILPSFHPSGQLTVCSVWRSHGLMCLGSNTDKIRIGLVAFLEGLV